MGTMSNRLNEAVKCCQFVEWDFNDGVKPNELDRELIDALASYAKAWQAGTSRKEAWKKDLEAV